MIEWQWAILMLDQLRVVSGDRIRLLYNTQGSRKRLDLKQKITNINDELVMQVWSEFIRLKEI